MRHYLYVLACLAILALCIMGCNKKTAVPLPGVYEISYQSGDLKYLGKERLTLYHDGHYTQEFTYANGKMKSNSGKWQIYHRSHYFLLLYNYAGYVDSMRQKLNHTVTHARAAFTVDYLSNSIEFTVDEDSDYHFRRIKDVDN